MNRKYISAKTEQYFSGFATGFIGKKTIVKYVESKSIAFTMESYDKKTVMICLSKQSPLLEVLPDDIVTVFRFGNLVHEILHQVYTDFYELKKYYHKSDYPKLFRLVFNIFEDARIEYHAEEVFGGDAISALNLDNEIGFAFSDEVNKAKSNIGQLLQALLQIKQAGKFKGSLSKEAENCFNEIIGLFSDAVKCYEGKKCVHLAYKATEIIVKNFDGIKEFEEKLTNQKLNEGSGEGQNFEGTGNSKSKVDECISEREKTNSTEKSKGEENTEKDTKSDKKSNTEDNSGDSQKSFSQENEEKTSPDIGDEKNIEKEISDRIKEFMCKISEKYKNTADNINNTISEFNTKNMDPFEMEDVFSDGEYTVVSEKANPENEIQYKAIVKSLSESINALASKIKKETATEPQRLSHSKKGRINIDRISNPSYTGTRLFLKKTIDGDHSAAMMIAVDISGSMSYNKRYVTARTSAIMIAEAFAKAKIPLIIIGYTTRKGHYEDIGYHKEYVSWGNTTNDRSSLLGMTPMQNNMDGPTIRWCIRELEKRREKNKVLIIISDGCPNAYNYEGKSAVMDTAGAVKEAKKHFNVLGISLTNETDNLRAFSSIYGDTGFICLKNSSELPVVLSQQIRKMSEKW